MKEDKLRLARAFTKTPSELSDAVEAAFRRGEQTMKKRHKMTIALTAAAACALILAGLALAAGRLTAPKPDPVVLAQATARVKPTPEVMPALTPMPEVTPKPTPTPEITPEPTPMPTPEPEISLVYTQPDSNYYHSDPNCSGMVGAVAWTEESAISVGKKPCPVCMSVEIDDAVETPELELEAIEAPMYYTEAGVYFHGDAHCSGMVGAEPHTIELALASGKQRCPVCQPIEPLDKDLYVLALGEAMYEGSVPGCDYAYTERDSDSGAYMWYARSREDADICTLMATFQPPIDHGEGLKAENLETGGLRMMVWLLGDTDYFSLLKEAPEPMRSMVEQVEAALSGMPGVASPSDSAQPSWDMRIVVGFDKDRMTISDVLIDALGSDTVYFRWERMDDGSYNMTSRTESGEAKG